MANTVKKISELPLLSELDGDALIPLSLRGVTYRLKLSEIKKLTEAGSNEEITKAFLGLGNVDNTSDADKPVSTAQALAFLTKADKVHGHALSDVAGLSDTLASLQSALSAMATELTGKAAQSHRHNIGDINSLETELNNRPTQSDIAQMLADLTTTLAENSVTFTKAEW